jgi:hypothetical protein
MAVRDGDLAVRAADGGVRRAGTFHASPHG